MTPDEQYQLLVDALRLVAASPEEQVSSLPDFVCKTDEVVLTFGDAYLLVAQLQRAGFVSSDAAVGLKRLDAHLEAMPTDKSLAEAESLGTHAFWEQARTLAGEVLQLLGEEKRPPDLSGTTWVRSKG